MSRRLSGFQPTGHLQLGNLLGAIRPTVAGQDDHESVVLVVDLHAMTVDHDPARLRELTLETATLLLAAGVDPERSLFYLQSHVPGHTELHYLLECATSYGEAHRMIQFKEKAAGQSQVRLSLLTYPTLMAADILLHGADEVPVGRPGVTNLLDILAGCVDDNPTVLARSFTSYRELKEAVADGVTATLQPIQARYADLRKDPDTVHDILARGALRAREEVGRQVD